VSHRFMYPTVTEIRPDAARPPQAVPPRAVRSRSQRDLVEDSLRRVPNRPTSRPGRPPRSPLARSGTTSPSSPTARGNRRSPSAASPGALVPRVARPFGLDVGRAARRPSESRRGGVAELGVDEGDRVVRYMPNVPRRSRPASPSRAWSRSGRRARPTSAPARSPTASDRSRRRRGRGPRRPHRRPGAQGRRRQEGPHRQAGRQRRPLTIRTPRKVRDLEAVGLVSGRPHLDDGRRGLIGPTPPASHSAWHARAARAIG